MNAGAFLHKKSGDIYVECLHKSEPAIYLCMNSGAQTSYRYWLVLKATLKNNAQSGGMLPEGQCWMRLTVNVCFVLSRNKCNKFVSLSMMQQHITRIDLPTTAVGPKCMVSRGLYHVPREHGSCDAMFPGNMTLHCRNRATLFIFAHHVTHIGPTTIA